MQITASLSGSTAIIATNRNGTSTTLTIKDASNLAADLAAISNGEVSTVEAVASTWRGTITPTRGAHHSGGSIPHFCGTSDLRPTLGGQRNQDFQVDPRGYSLASTDTGVRIVTPAGTGQNEAKINIPFAQLAGLIAQLNA